MASIGSSSVNVWVSYFNNNYVVLRPSLWFQSALRNGCKVKYDPESRVHLKKSLPYNYYKLGSITI